MQEELKQLNIDIENAKKTGNRTKLNELRKKSVQMAISMASE